MGVLLIMFMVIDHVHGHCSGDNELKCMESTCYLG